MFFAAAAMAASLVLLVLPNGARAADGDLQRALLEAGCVRADVKALPRKGRASVYEANCFGSSHKVIDVVCVDDRCVASSPAAESERFPG